MRIIITRSLFSLAVVLLLVSFVPASAQDDSGQLDCRLLSLPSLPNYISVHLTNQSFVRAVGGAVAVEAFGVWYHIWEDERKSVSYFFCDDQLGCMSVAPELTLNTGILPGFPSTTQLEVCEPIELEATSTPADMSDQGCQLYLLEPGQNRLVVDTGMNDSVVIRAPHGDAMIHLPYETILLHEGEDSKAIPFTDIESVQNLEDFAHYIEVCWVHNENTPTQVLDPSTVCVTMTSSPDINGNAYIPPADMLAAFGGETNGQGWTHSDSTLMSAELTSGGASMCPTIHLNGNAWLGLGYLEGHYHEWSMPGNVFIGGGCTGGRWEGGTWPFTVILCVTFSGVVPSPTPLGSPQTATSISASRTSAVSTATAAPSSTPPSTSTSTSTGTLTPPPAEGCQDIVFSSPNPRTFNMGAGVQFWQVGYTPLSARLRYLVDGSSTPHDVPLTMYTVQSNGRYSFYYTIPSPPPVPPVLRVCGSAQEDIDTPDYDSTDVATLSPPPGWPTSERPDYEATMNSNLATIAADVSDPNTDFPGSAPTVPNGDSVSPGDALMATALSEHGAAFADQGTQQALIATSQKSNQDIQNTQIAAIEWNPMLPGSLPGTSTPFSFGDGMGTAQVAFDGKEPFDTIDNLTGIYSDTNVILEADNVACDGLTFLDVDLEDFVPGTLIPLHIKEPFCQFIDNTVTIRTMIRIFSVLMIAYGLWFYLNKRMRWLGA